LRAGGASRILAEEMLYVEDAKVSLREQRIPWRSWRLTLRPFVFGEEADSGRILWDLQGREDPLVVL